MEGRLSNLPAGSVANSLAGTIEGDHHRLFQRVYYEDTDFSGAVYHARYLHFLERGRTDYLRCLGVSQGALARRQEDGIAFVVRHMDLDFRAPARMDDVLEIRTSTRRTQGARIFMEQQIFCDERLLINAIVTVAVINELGRARRLPDDFITLFERKVSP